MRWGWVQCSIYKALQNTGFTFTLSSQNRYSKMCDFCTHAWLLFPMLSFINPALTQNEGDHTHALDHYFVLSQHTMSWRRSKHLTLIYFCCWVLKRICDKSFTYNVYDQRDGCVVSTMLMQCTYINNVCAIWSHKRIYDAQMFVSKKNFTLCVDIVGALATKKWATSFIYGRPADRRWHFVKTQNER
jgi:hypothetical protein